MPFDDNLVLLDGSVDLTPTSDADAVSTTANAYGNKVIDLGKTGNKGLCAVMILPDAPTDYQDTLTAYIQHSNHYAAGWETVAGFPVLYAYVREMLCTPTTAFVGADDIAATLVATTDSDSDGGVVIDFDEELLTIGLTGRILVQMSDSNDDYSTASDTLTSGGTGVGTQGVAASLTKSRSYGIYVVRFQTERRYVRGQFTVTSGGNFGNVKLMLTGDYPVTPQLG